MKYMKILCCLILGVIILFLSSCSLNDVLKNESMAETDNSDSQKTAVDQIVIQALEDNDAEAIKSLFSVHAKSLCADLDKEIEYMFSIYEGEYVESTQHNYSSEKHSGDYETCIIYPVCVFKTTESYYKLTWNEWTINEKDKDKVGVYSMKLEVWPDAGLNQDLHKKVKSPKRKN